MEHKVVPVHVDELDRQPLGNVHAVVRPHRLHCEHPARPMFALANVCVAVGLRLDEVPLLHGQCATSIRRLQRNWAILAINVDVHVVPVVQHKVRHSWPQHRRAMSHEGWLATEGANATKRTT